MTDREYRKLQANFRRQQRLGLPYSPTRVGMVPLIASAWREYWRPDPAIGVPADIQAMVMLCGLGLVACGVVGFIGMCCGF